MITIKAAAWAQPATYNNGAWSCPDAMIGKFLNNACVPAVKSDDDAALALVESQFTGVELLEDAPPVAAASDWSAEEPHAPTDVPTGMPEPEGGES